MELYVLWHCLQDETEASYVATLKTIRQVKTVFIIFIAFFSCWSPYVIILLYDRSDSLPLPVHLYSSMIAHLHASLNFAIYSLSNRNVCARYRLRRTTPSSVAAAAAAAAANSISIARQASERIVIGGIGSGVDDASRTLVSVECYQLQELDGCHRAAAETYHGHQFLSVPKIAIVRSGKIT